MAEKKSVYFMVVGRTLPCVSPPHVYVVLFDSHPASLPAVHAQLGRWAVDPELSNFHWGMAAVMSQQATHYVNQFRKTQHDT